MKRKLLILLLALASTFALCFGLAACGGSDDGDETNTGQVDNKDSEGLEFTLNDNEYTVTGIGTCKDTVISIPETYKGLPVTGIGYEAFSNCYSLTKIIIPDGVTSIGSYAFNGCYLLTSVTIGSSVKSIGMATFMGCSSLESIVLPDSLTSIGYEAISYCSSLTSITIPDSVTNMEYEAFSGCNALTIYCQAASQPSEWNIEWNFQHPVVWDCDNNDKDGNGYAYSVIDGIRYSLKDGEATVVGQPTNITSANMPSSVTYKNKVYGVTNIGSSAFSDCSSLESVSLPDSVTNIEDYAFTLCSSLESIKVASENTKYRSSGNCLIETATETLILGCKNSIIPDDGSVTNIGEYAFQYCSSLESIIIPDSVTCIGDYAFRYCNSLTNVTIGNGVTSIRQGAFSNCYSLTKIIMPDSVTSIRSDAFWGCSSLTSINFAGTKEQWNAISKDSDWNYNTGNYAVHCTDGDISK